MTTKLPVPRNLDWVQAERFAHAGKDDCPQCDGCGYMATDDDRSPWWVWAALRPPSDLAVRMSIVQPVECDKCHATGKAQP